MSIWVLGYGIFAILLPGLLDTIHYQNFTSRDMGYCVQLHGYCLKQIQSKKPNKAQSQEKKDFFQVSWKILNILWVHVSLGIQNVC